MVFKHNISADTRSYVYYLYKHANRSLRYIAKECCISPSSVVRIVKAGIHSHKINSKKSTKKSETHEAKCKAATRNTSDFTQIARTEPKFFSSRIDARERHKMQCYLR